MRLDVAGVVVAFHLEDHGQFLAVRAVANVGHARVLARAADHLRAGGGQGPQPFLGRLVGTMLVPHRREDAEFGKARLAPQQVEDALVFVGFQPMRRDQVGGDGGVLHGWSFRATETCRLVGRRAAPFNGLRAGASRAAFSPAGSAGRRAGASVRAPAARAAPAVPAGRAAPAGAGRRQGRWWCGNKGPP